MEQNKSPYRLFIKYKFLVAICAILSLGLGLFYFSGNLRFTKAREGQGSTGKTAAALNPGERALGNVRPDGKQRPDGSEQGSGSGQQLTLLLLGTDKRPNDQSIGNTDTIIVAKIDAGSGQINLLSVPRDTEINIPGFGHQKLNAVGRLENGPPSIESELEQLLGMKIDGYILTNFAGFKGIIDTLGGVMVTVDKDMYYQTGDAEDGVISLKKGRQRLDGSQALQYIRFRHDQLGDITRTMRQQTLLKSVGSEFMQLKTIPKLPWLIPQIYRMVKTDLSVNELLSLGNAFLHLNDQKMISETLPGNFYMEKGISYWKVSPEECRWSVSQFFNHDKTTPVLSNDINHGQAVQNDLTVTDDRKRAGKGNAPVNQSEVISSPEGSIQVEIQYSNKDSDVNKVKQTN